MQHHKPLNLCILTQDENNRSCKLLKEELEKQGHKVTLIQYENNRASDGYKSWQIDEKKGVLTREGKTITISDFDGVMVRSWGTAGIANEYARIFEEQGVTVANSPENTARSNSKVDTTQAFQGANIPMPDTKTFLFEGMEDEELRTQVERFFEGKDRMVIKPDYGTRGETIKFPTNVDEALKIIGGVKSSGDKGFVLQEFVHTAEPPQSYRLLVVGGKVVCGMHLTAAQGEMVTNTAKGGTTKFLEKISWRKRHLAKKAAEALGMECCSGVDILIGSDGRMVVLEANDGPKISTAVDEHKFHLHKLVAQAFISKVKGRGQEMTR